MKGCGMKNLSRAITHMQKATDLLNEILAGIDTKPKYRVPGGPPPASGFRGVTKDKRTGRFGAKAWVNGKSKWVGTYETAEQAAAAVMAYEASQNTFTEVKNANFD
jgi:hypothetical protein